MKEYLVQIILVIAILLSGCASKSPTSVSDIKDVKHEERKKRINITYHSKYSAYVDRSDKVRFIANDDVKCNYYNEDKHSYANIIIDEEIIGMSENTYSPYRSPDKVQCGTGSLAGWLAILAIPIDDRKKDMLYYMKIRDYTSLNKYKCRYRYTQVKNTQIIHRFVVGLLTFMTPFVTGGNMHTREFDEDAFRESVNESNMESYKEKLFELTSQYEIDGGFDIIYLEKGDIEDSLEDKYEELQKSKSRKAGVIFLDDATNELISIIVFDKYKDSSLMQSISLEIDELFINAALSDKNILTNEEVMSYIPAEITIPILPIIKKPIKSEYQKLSDFNKKVQDAVSLREASIRELQRNYSLDVMERNIFIDNLAKGYKLYVENSTKNKNELVEELKNNIPLLAKIMFLENISGYGADEFEYDVEEERLYFKIFSNKGGFSQQAVANIPVDIAKEIKENKTFKIAPHVVYENKLLKLKGFEIIETESDDSFKVSYTDVNFTPEVVSIAVVGKKEIINKEFSNQFAKYKQVNSPIVDTTKKEIWYVDIANRVNAKIPSWFTSPINNNDTMAYGEGNTLTQAKNSARDELAKIIKVHIDSSYKSVDIANEFASSTKIEQRSVQTSTVDLDTSDYKLVKQDSVDGRWYVALKYLK